MTEIWNNVAEFSRLKSRYRAQFLSGGSREKSAPTFLLVDMIQFLEFIRLRSYFFLDCLGDSAGVKHSYFFKNVAFLIKRALKNSKIRNITLIT